MKNQQDPHDQKLAEFEAKCHQHKLPLTPQRRAVLEVLLRHTDHPSADQIYEEMRFRMPGISRTTVYRVLETLVRLGLAVKVFHPGAVARFDPVTQPHHHLYCFHCGSLTDLYDTQFEGVPFPENLPQGFEIVDFSVYFRGACSDCQRQHGSDSFKPTKE